MESGELNEPTVAEEEAAAEAALLQELEEIRSRRQKPTTTADGVTEADAARAEPDTGDDGVVEFNTHTPKPVHFRLDGEDMYAAGVMPAGFMLDVIENRVSMRNTDRAGQMRIILDMLKSVLFESSMAAVQRRMYSPENPIEFETIVRMVNWLTGKVYRRPTQRSSVSPGEQPKTGTTSTDGAQPETSTREDFETTPSAST